MAIWRYSLIAVGLLLFLSSIAQAAILDAVDRGTYTQLTETFPPDAPILVDAGAHASSTKDYSVGRATRDYGFEIDQYDYHNFFVFDLSSVAGKTIYGATLEVNTLGVVGGGTYTLYDVATDIPTLCSTQSDNGDIYADLGSQAPGHGLNYGSISIQPSQQNAVIDIALNSAFISAASLATGQLAIGGALTFPGSAANQYAFASASEVLLSETRLFVTTPEPGSLALILTGVASWLALAYRRRKM